MRATFRVAGKNIPGTLVMLFDRTGRLASTAKVEIREACSLSFNARKPR